MYICLEKEGIAKHSRNEIMQLLWKIVTHLIKKMLDIELNMILILLMEFVYIRHS